MKKSNLIITCGIGALAVLICATTIISSLNNKTYTMANFVMDTTVDQKVYGPSANKAMKAVQAEFERMENTLSMHIQDSEIAQINLAAGKDAVKISEATFAFLEKAKALALASEDTFALTIAPLSSAWGVTTDTPRVVPDEELSSLLKLVDDNDIILENGTARLARAGQAIDLGGIAKGEACDIAAQIYQKNGVKSALLSVGSSSILAYGQKPDGSGYRIGFRNPKASENAYICSFILKNQFMSTSGGYERFFEKDGKRYHHILDPKTGRPAQSEIVSISVIANTGAKADVLSTELYVKGLDAAIEFLNDGGSAIVLDEKNKLHISSDILKTLSFAQGLESQYEVIAYE